MTFFKELQRRNVFRIAIGYVVLAWLLLQVSDTLVPALRLPDWFHSGVAFLLILGFPVALFLAWAYEMTPDGIRSEKDIDRNRPATPGSGRKLDFAIIGLLAAALVYFVWESRFENVDGMAADATRSELPSSTNTETTATEVGLDKDRLSIAVLPFDNRSNLEEDQFFTDGIHDDLLTTIAKIGSMKVISRTSVMEYRGTVKKIPQIAKELGVTTILEGGIQRSGSQVLINVQLIDAVSDEHLWAEYYDRELSAENLFAIQSEITNAIADALSAALSPEEKQRIDATATNSLLALEAYQRGRRLMATRNTENMKSATEEFNQAVELDPRFALAWVGVADSNHLYSTYNRTIGPDSYAIVDDAIGRALAIDAGLGEAYAIKGLSTWSRKGPDQAEAAFKQAIALSPNYATAWQWYANSLALDSGRMNESIELLGRAAQLDPRSSIIGMNLGTAFKSVGLYSRAERQYLNVVEQNPDFAMANNSLINFYLAEVGRYDQALYFALKARVRDPDNLRYLNHLVNIYLGLGDLAAAENIHQQMIEVDANHRVVNAADLWIHLRKDDPDRTRAVLDRLLPKIPDRPNI